MKICLCFNVYLHKIIARLYFTYYTNMYVVFNESDYTDYDVIQSR